MGTYILCGKDENGLNAVQRGEIYLDNKRYSSFKKSDEKILSLDEILENPLADQSALKKAQERYIYTKKKPQINRPHYDKETGEITDRGDMDIPGMQNLWDSIDRMEHLIATLDGRLPTPDGVDTSSYRIYRLRHNLISLRQMQYALKDSYNPPIHFQSLDRPRPQFIDWSEDCFYWITLEQWQQRVNNALTHLISRNLSDYETKEVGDQTYVKWVVALHTFDWENIKHVKAIMNYYDIIRDHMREKFDTYGRMLIFDFDRYRAMCNFSEIRNFILQCKLEKFSHPEILWALSTQYGLTYNENHLSNILAREIPGKFVEVATKHRLMVETPRDQLKKCHTCGRLLPPSPLFFVRNKTRRDGLSSNCKECEKAKRIEKGGCIYDRRVKETQMFAVQTGKV